MTDGSVWLDEHIVVACPPREALECLNGPVAIAGWFGCKRAGSQTTIASAGGDLVVELAHEEWLPDDGALLVIGTTGDVWLRAHLTVRAVMQPGAHPYLHPGTEIWTHVELGPARRASRLTALLQDVLRDGLEHLRLELDTFRNHEAGRQAMRRSHKRDWVKRLAPEHEYYEYNLERLTGQAATLTCDGTANELVVTMPKIRGHQVELVADELATLWPGFLAPAGVSLRINQNHVGDGEAMAIRYHANRQR